MLARLLLCGIRKILSGIDVKTQAMTCTSLRERALDGLVDIDALDSSQRNRLIAVVHDGQVLDVLQSFDGHTDLYPASSPVGEIVPPIGTFVDGVGRFGIVGFHFPPRPCPGEIGQLALLLHVLVAVDGIEHRENRVFLHRWFD